MMSDPVESFLNEQKPMLELVGEILDGWNGEGCYKVPALVLAVAGKLNWNSDQARRNDPLIRAYLKDHPTWYVTRGAHGGIMKRAEHDKKEAAKLAKEKAKQEIALTLAAKMAQQTSPAPAVIDSEEIAQDNIDSE